MNTLGQRLLKLIEEGSHRWAKSGSREEMEREVDEVSRDAQAWRDLDRVLAAVPPDRPAPAEPLNNHAVDWDRHP